MCRSRQFAERERRSLLSGRYATSAGDRGHSKKRCGVALLPGEPLHESYQLVTSIATLTSECQELVEFRYDSSLFGRPRHPDRSTSPHLQ